LLLMPLDRKGAAVSIEIAAWDVALSALLTTPLESCPNHRSRSSPSSH
jgi:hypothetical protein